MGDTPMTPDLREAGRVLGGASRAGRAVGSDRGAQIG
jgi:hypothetical protein